MKKIKVIMVLLAIVTIHACEKKTYVIESSEEVTNSSDYGSSNASTAEDYTIRVAYSDGTYCADVVYYNPNTGNSSTYILNVEVENNEVTVIYWPNGGWLDSSHFYPEELDSDGYCSFSSDKGYHYTIQITGSECDFTDDIIYEEKTVNMTCIECGGDKDYEYEDYCYNCKRKKEDIEEHTCKRCGNYSVFVGALNPLCSDCTKE